MTANDLMSILACPLCKGQLTPTAAGNGLICNPCALIYPIRDSIPIMLPDEALVAISGKAPDNAR